ncbi:MAG TPA: hypothetical protein VLI05_03125 [Candidatus Saccharimonadia bacterium]|nr:hypothetical protein [Candidatus Saccharimonadia bacterium]
MPKRNDSHARELFFLETLPQIETDPFSAMSTEIQDDHTFPAYEEIQGLSSEQVSNIARDSLDKAASKADDQLFTVHHFDSANEAETPLPE